MNLFKICVKVACDRCPESLLVWVEPWREDVVVGFERVSFCSEEQSPVTRDDVLLLRRDDVLDAARDEGWTNHFQNDMGLVCPKCRSK